MKRYALRGDQWERIKNLLPGHQDSVGCTARNNRLFDIATRYDKTARNFLSAIYLAASVIWLN